MSAAVGALSAKVRPQFWVVVLAVAGAGLLIAVVIFIFSFSEATRDQAESPKPQRDRSETGAQADIPPLPLRNERRLAAASPQSEPAKTQEPAPAGEPPPQTGQASWYDFHGKTTANGEKMDRGTLTAAHKSLPLGSKVIVENLDNGREVEVRINDRGPFAGGRIIDLSKEAAAHLDMLGQGVAEVIVKPAEAAAPGTRAQR